MLLGYHTLYQVSGYPLPRRRFPDVRASEPLKAYNHKLGQRSTSSLFMLGQRSIYLEHAILVD